MDQQNDRNMEKQKEELVQDPFVDEMSEEEETLVFPDEEEEGKKKGVIRWILMGAAILLCLCMAGGGLYWYISREKESEQTEKVAQEPVFLREAVPWDTNEELVAAYRDKTLADYPDATLGEAIDAVDKDAVWKTGTYDQDSYLYCQFTEGKVQMELIAGDSPSGGLEILEFYQNGTLQEEDETRKICSRIFQKTEPNDGVFIGRLDYVYKIEDYNYPVYITLRDEKDKNVSVNINVSDGLYDLTYEGTVTSGNVVQFSMEPGEKIRLTWKDEDTFRAAPEDGFTDESIQMVRMLCECLNNQTYQAYAEAPEEEEEEKEEAEKEEEAVSATQPPEGVYWEGDKPPLYAMYYVELYNMTEQGFDFAVYGRYDEEEDFGLVFKHHTAEFTGADTAVYNGQKYTLTFRWEKPGYLTVEGFPEWIPAGSDPLYNNAYLGVS